MCYTHLTRAQRYQIEVLIQAQQPVDRIASKLGVHRSTVYRELRRGRCGQHRYSSSFAQDAAQRRVRRSAANHPTKPASLWKRIRSLLRRDWSPEQVRGWLRRWGQAAASVPAIYAHVRADKNHGGRLHEHLRYRHRRFRWGHQGTAGMPPNRPHISQRPLAVTHRRQLGHWEGDTVKGSSHGSHRLLTLVERKSRFLQLRHAAGMHASSVVAQNSIQALQTLPVRSITFDNGSEFARYRLIQQALRCNIYFTNRHSPWERGTCENTIGLLRQYVPKGTSGKNLSPVQLQQIQNKLNSRPRKCLGYRTPYEVFFNKSPVALRS